MLPVEAQTAAVAPSSSALETATVIPRSLNDPVGLRPSYLSSTRQPVISEIRGAASSGVEPSPSSTTGVASVTGSRSR